LRKLDDLLIHARLGQTVTALVARGGRLLRLPLQLPAADDAGEGVWHLPPRARADKPNRRNSALLMQWPLR
jgi:hypothetical protein